MVNILAWNFEEKIARVGQRTSLTTSIMFYTNLTTFSYYISVIIMEPRTREDHNFCAIEK